MVPPLLLKNAKTLLLLNLVSLLVFSGFSAKASHLRAGEIYYTSDTTATRNPLKFFFTLVTYSVAPPPFEDLEATLYFGDCTSQKVSRESRTLIPNAQISSFQNIYRFEHTYSGPGTYLVTYVAQSRNMGVVNISNSVSQTFFLQSTLTVDPLLGVNRSPRLRILPLDVAVRNQVFVHNPGAYDPDGDSLSFKLVAPKDFSSNDACGRPIGRDAQGYQGLENFLGRADPSGPAGYALNRNTGQLTWNTPGIIGEFALALVVEEWRNGRLIGQVTRDRQLFVRGEPIVTGLSEDWYSLVSTFPNPAASAFTLKLPPSIQLRASSLYTAQGTPVPLPVPTRSKEGLVFPIQSLPNALYFLHLRTSQGNHIQKIVVQR